MPHFSKGFFIFAVILICAAFYFSHQAEAVTRLGLFATQEEIDIWKQRAQSGLYKTRDDVDPQNGDYAPKRASRPTSDGNYNVEQPLYYNGFGKCDTSPTRKLPSVDFSFAGYRQNNAPVPYGQRQAAVAYGQGRHTITNIINLQSGDVLRGTGRDKTVLYFPQGLREIGPSCNSSTCYEWDDSGLIVAKGSEVGIEDVTIELPAHTYKHYAGLTNPGFNAITLVSCTNCWVKNVTVRNGDRGIFIKNSSDSTVDGARVYANPNGSHIHIGVSTYSKRVAVTNFEVYGTSFHGLTGNWGPELMVFANGTRDNVRIEPDHNCNGTGGLDSCVKNVLYSNISGSGSIQGNTGRDGKPLPSPPILWNVDKVDRCPLDAYTSQLEKR